jgi:hypothetical protein
MTQWEVNEENAKRWWSECRDVGPGSTERGAIYWRNVAYVLLRYVLFGDKAISDFVRPRPPLSSEESLPLLSWLSRSGASSGASSSTESRGG